VVPKRECRVKIKEVPFNWIPRWGYRLDVEPFVGGSVETRVYLENAPYPKEPLHDLTAGYNGGIFNGPMFRRNYVKSPEHGVPFLTSGSMLRADLSDVSLLRRKDAESPKLSYLRLTKGTTLISCSGSIGRTVYTRPDMEGMWASQDIMKVVPDPAKVPPGYLFAFLSSKFGISMVTSGTYGAIIQHIEPEHIANLPVPRLGAEKEGHVHVLMETASESLAQYQRLIDEASFEICSERSLPFVTAAQWNAVAPLDLSFSVRASESEPLRALNHSRRAHVIKDAIRSGPWCELGDVIDLSWLRWRVMFKRMDCEPEHGIEVITQRPLFHLIPEGRWISKKYLLNLSPRFVVPERTILIAKQGTLGENELYCQAELVFGARAIARAYSDHCMRVVVKDGAIHPGYLFAFLGSEPGFRLLRSLSEGSKQQDLHWRTVPHIPVPRLTDRAREEGIGEKVMKAYQLRSEAVDRIIEAQETCEEAIEEVA